MARHTILHLIDTGGPGGAETVFADLVSRLPADRWRSVVTVPEEDWLSSELRRAGVEPIPLPTDGAFDLSYLRRIVRLVRREGVDLIQAHLLTAGVYGALAGRLTRVPVVCTFHGHADMKSDERYRFLKFRVIDREPNRIVFVSDPLRRAFLDQIDLEIERTAVIPNGIDCERFRPGRDSSVRRELDIASDAIVVGAIGNVRAPKAYDNLLEAAALLREHTPRFRFVIAGDTRSPLYDGLLQHRDALGLSETVTFLGFREDVDRVLRNLDIYVIASHTEGFSLATVQAMACGLPVIATRSGGPETIIDDRRTGILVEPGDPRALADAIRYLAAEPARRVRLGEAARETVARRFSLEATIDAYQQLYRGRVGNPVEEAIPVR